MLTFTVNCTVLVSGSRFVSSPNVRGTLDILWSCLSIIFLCTWSVQHLSVPARTYPAMKKQKFRKALMRFHTRSQVMLANLIAPEYFIALACTEWLKVRQSFKDLQEYVQQDDVVWTKAHCFCAISGGFVLCFPESHSTDRLDQSSGVETYSKSSAVADSRPRAPFPSTKSRELVLNLEATQSRIESYQNQYRSSGWKSLQMNRDLATAAAMISVEDFTWAMKHGVTHLQGNHWFMNLEQLLYCRRIGLITTLPNIPEDTVSEFGQGDSIIKILTAAQVCWVIFRVAVRGIRSFHTTQLEISTIASDVCSVIAYISWFNKPQNPITNMELKCQRMPSPEECLDFLRLAGKDTPLLRISTNDIVAADYNYKRVVKFWILDSVGAVIFGSIPFIAWNFSFPTSIERTIWRISCILMVSVPVSSCSLVYLAIIAGGPAYLGLIFSVTIWVVYALARLFMWIETIRSLIYAEPAAFFATWTQNIPHIA